MPRAKHPHVNKANKYARDVVAGKILASKYVRLACQRHLDDLKAEKRKAFEYRFNKGYAKHACDFIESLPHTKGRWAVARPGNPKSNLIRLEPWQCFIVCVLFGWVQKKDGLRRFRETYFEIPRKNGKSLLAAAIGLYMFAVDSEVGSEVYSGATKEKQAWEVFRPARLMVKRTEEFRDACGIEIGAKNLCILEDESRFEPVVGNPGDGASPHCGIVDEYHEHKTENLLETFQTGMGARTQPILFVITTAGSDLAGPCYAARGDAIKVLEGSADDPQLFAMIYTIDEEDDWTSEDALLKANPNFDISVSGDYLRAQQRAAINSARKQNKFKTKHLNVWVGSRSPWMNLESWNACADPELTLDDFRDDEAIGGVDVSSKKDLTSWARIFVKEIDGEEHFFIFSEHWLPEDTAADPEKAVYAGWAIEGFLTLTDGPVLDLDDVELMIQDAGKVHPLGQIGFDPWGAYQLMNNLMAGKNGRKLECVEIPQTTRYLSEPMKWLAAYADAGRLHHNGDPILTWCVSNVVCKEDPNGNIFPRKERDENKIDAAVALIIAFSLVLMGEGDRGSVYDERGITVIGLDPEG
jgi:phage terminase large subunit-like protein